MRMMLSETMTVLVCDGDNCFLTVTTVTQAAQLS